MDSLWKKLTFSEKRKNTQLFSTSRYPKVYNYEGRALDFFYLQDQLLWPYSGSRYFMWDRCNFGLNVHFYTHNNMLYPKGKPREKYGMLIESKQVVPDNYRIFKKKKGLDKEFDAIFTYDAELLNELPNAKFFPACANVWYGKKEDAFEWDRECFRKKSKGISIVSSDKKMCYLHKVRYSLSMYCKKNNLADTFGTFDGGRLCLIDDSLKDYRYSIIIENDISDYFFTEKITNCFAAQTIPVYLGAGKIGEFFNKDGIIFIRETDLNDIESVLRQCTEEEYLRRLPAIMDNYQRVQQYKNIYDYLYEHYFIGKDILEKNS